MKRFAVAALLTLACGSALAGQAEQAYTSALHAASEKCHLMSFSAEMDYDTGMRKAEMDAQLSGGMMNADPVMGAYHDSMRKVAACLDEAKASAVSAYKTFADMAKTQDLKNAGREVLSTYVAYLKVATTQDHDENTPEAAAWRKAESDLDVAAALNE